MLEDKFLNNFSLLKICLIFSPFMQDICPFSQRLRLVNEKESDSDSNRKHKKNDSLKENRFLCFYLNLLWKIDHIFSNNRFVNVFICALRTDTTFENGSLASGRKPRYSQ